MAQNITIAGATFNAVPSIVVPTDNNGSAIFVDPSPTTATASDVASGKYFFNARGALTQGTASGGGGGGSFTVETGTWTPSSDVVIAEISFNDTHIEEPVLTFLYDSADSYNSTTNTPQFGLFVYHYKWPGFTVYPSSSVANYAIAFIRTRATDTSAFTTTTFSVKNNTMAITSSDYVGFWVSSTKFRMSSASSRPWKSGRTYKWVAVWK